MSLWVLSWEFAIGLRAFGLGSFMCVQASGMWVRSIDFMGVSVVCTHALFYAFLSNCWRACLSYFPGFSCSLPTKAQGGIPKARQSILRGKSMSPIRVDGQRNPWTETQGLSLGR